MASQCIPTALAHFHADEQAVAGVNAACGQKRRGVACPSASDILREVRVKIAALYDIHGNLPALEAVIAEVKEERVDRVIIGGDVVPGPMPCETFDYLLGLNFPTEFIRGNTDREVLARMQGEETDWFRDAPSAWSAPVEWAAGKLRSDHAAAMARWPSTCAIDVPELGEVLFCHATPESDDKNLTRLTPDDEVLFALGGIQASTVVCGHTHMQYNRTVGGVALVNAGSVGLPFGNPGAYWLLIDSGEVQLRRTQYDLAVAVERISATDYPEAADFATNFILNPPTEADMLAVFSPDQVKRE